MARNRGRLSLWSLLRSANTLRWIAILTCVIVVVAGVITMVIITRNDSVAVTTTATDDGLLQVIAMREIGEWECLSVDDEELVDTVRKTFLGSDYLARIYYGTLRFGFDLREAPDDWIVASGDSLYVTLPAVRLLDERFIDESRTRTFYESGTWRDAVRAVLLQKAYRLMRRRCVTAGNLHTAREQAKREVCNILSALGYNNVEIVFVDER